MNILKKLGTTVLDALFPLSSAEQELFLLSPEAALQELGRAPDYSGLAVPLPGARSVFAYKDERVAKLVWNIKYKRSALAVKIGGYALWHEFSESHNSDASATTILIIPIPITAQRRRERGYNQCELLIDEVERLLKEQIDLSLVPNAERIHYVFEKNLLIRTHHAARQTLKGREDRVESAQGIFGVDEKAIERLGINILKDSGTAIEKVRVIMVDDVITTGSTMHEAIETLKKAGFEDVRALSLAH